MDKLTLKTYFDRTFKMFVELHNKLIGGYAQYQDVSQIENMVNRLLSLSKIDYAFAMQMNEAVSAYRKIDNASEAELDKYNQVMALTYNDINEKLASLI